MKEKNVKKMSVSEIKQEIELSKFERGISVKRHRNLLTELEERGYHLRCDICEKLILRDDGITLCEECSAKERAKMKKYVVSINVNETIEAKDEDEALTTFFMNIENTPQETLTTYFVERAVAKEIKEKNMKNFHSLPPKKRYSIVIYFKNGSEKHSLSRTPSLKVAERWKRQAKLNDLVKEVNIIKTFD